MGNVLGIISVISISGTVGERSKRQNFFEDNQDPDFGSEFPSRPLFISKGFMISQPAPLASFDDDANNSTERQSNESPTTETSPPTTNTSVEVVPAVPYHEKHYQFDNNERNPENRGFHFRKNIYWFNNFRRPWLTFDYRYQPQPYHHHPGFNNYQFYFYHHPFGGYPRFPSRFNKPEQNYEEHELKYDTSTTTTETIPNFSLDIDVRINI